MAIKRPAIRLQPICLRQLVRGFSLLELMVVVVVVGILAAIAYPNYSEYISRAKRTEAKAALLKLATNQEKFYLQNQAFTTDLLLLGFDADPFSTDSGAYNVTIAITDPSNDFTATATYQPDDAESLKCKTFTIDAVGTKGSGPDTNCWERSR